MELLLMLFLLQAFTEIPAPLDLCAVDILSVWAFARPAVHYASFRRWTTAFFHNHIFSQLEWNLGHAD